MGLKSFVILQVAKAISRKIDGEAKRPLEYQDKIFNKIVARAKDTAFGKDHRFGDINNYEDFKRLVPIRDYEALKPYMERVIAGEPDILWPGKPKYFAKTSGTTSGTKYIPLTRESIPNHFGTARNAVFRYMAKTGQAGFMSGKLIFLSGSPVLEEKNGIKTGRLSGISNHMVPAWLRLNQMPSFETNCIEDWEEKVSAIVEETFKEDMRLIGGIPPWVQMYFEKLLEKTGKNTIKEIFPKLDIFVYGGVNYEPYRQKLESLMGGKIPSVELFPASEGFFAFQDEPEHKGLLLNVNSGIFYEFVPADEIFSETPTRLSLKDVKVGVNYALIINNNAGLWGYNIGDTVEFVSTIPYRLKVTGRIKHYISAFGEHVIGKEVETALLEAVRQCGGSVVEFTVAPQVTPPNDEKPYHEWFIAFSELPKNMEQFNVCLDLEMQRQNIYYADLVEGNILQPLKVRALAPTAFVDYMKSIGKLGGQNKVPRLSNDRNIAEALASRI